MPIRLRSSAFQAAFQAARQRLYPDKAARFSTQKSLALTTSPRAILYIHTVSMAMWNGSKARSIERSNSTFRCVYGKACLKVVWRSSEGRLIPGMISEAKIGAHRIAQAASAEALAGKSISGNAQVAFRIKQPRSRRIHLPMRHTHYRHHAYNPRPSRFTAPPCAVFSANPTRG